MKKFLVLVLFLLVGTQLFAQVFWSNLTVREKTFVVAGYITGFSHGVEGMMNLTDEERSYLVFQVQSVLPSSVIEALDKKVLPNFDADVERIFVQILAKDSRSKGLLRKTGKDKYMNY